jgi:hypothetical protein
MLNGEVFAACPGLAAAAALRDGWGRTGFSSQGTIARGGPIGRVKEHLNHIVTMTSGTLRLQLGIACWTKASLGISVEGLTLLKGHDNIEMMATMAALVLVHRGVHVAHRASPSNDCRLVMIQLHLEEKGPIKFEQRPAASPRNA